MKWIAKFLAFLTLIVLLAGGYYVWATRLATSVTIDVVPASDWQETFDVISQGVRTGDFQSKGALGSSDAYSFVTLAVAIKNNNLFDANWVQLMPEEREDDLVIVLNNTGPVDLGFREKNTLYIRYLSSSSDKARRATLDYYILGRLYSIDIDFSGTQTPEQ